MDLKGTHGTSRTRAHQIVASQTFKPSTQAWYVDGIYFWAVVSNPSYARENAELWWKFASKKEVYANDPDKACAVLEVTISKTEEYFDASTDEFHEKLHAVLTKFDVRSSSSVKETFSFLISEIQDERQVEFLVLRVRVPTPPPLDRKDLGLSQEISKMSPAFVVKENGMHLIKEIVLAER